MATATDFAAQELVDEEIAAEVKRHQEHIKVLNIRRNSFCAVNRLPSDVLACILLYVKQKAEASNMRLDTSYSPSYSQCMVLLHVCHTWHDHVMNDARFWSTINLNLPAAQASKMLARSKAALLQIQLRVPSTVPSAQEEALWSLVRDVLSEPHTLRLQELSVTSVYGYGLSRALAFIPPTSRVPHLERLSIHVESLRETLSGDLWPDLPSLQSLTLIGGPLPLTTNSMPHLTLLSIRDQPSDHCVTIPWLLAALKHMPNIQDVTIQDLHGPNVEPHLPPVSLPHLLSLRLGSLNPSTLSILNHIVTPSSSKVQLLYGNVRLHALKGADFSSLNNAISRRLAAVTSIDEVTLSVSRGFDLAVYLREEHGHGSSSERLNPAFHCLFPFPFLPTPGTHIFRQLCKAIPLHQISTLSLHELTTSIGLSFIPSCAKMKNLVMHNCDVHILRALLIYKNAARPHNPELESIHFHETNFPNRLKNGMYAVLREVICTRKEYMIPIKTVTLEKCEIADSELNDLRELVEVLYI